MEWREPVASLFAAHRVTLSPSENSGTDQVRPSPAGGGFRCLNVHNLWDIG